MDARSRYTHLLEQLYLARSEQPLTLDQECEFACDLEALWHQLSGAEQGEIETLTEEYKRVITAPNELGTDLLVGPHEHTPPRKAA